MLDFNFLMFFPCLNQPCSSFVTQIDGTAGHVDEAVRANLTATHKRDDESVGNGSQFFGKIKSQGGAPCSWTMEEAHLIIQPNAFQGAHTLRH